MKITTGITNNKETTIEYRKEIPTLKFVGNHHYTNIQLDFEDDTYYTLEFDMEDISRLAEIVSKLGEQINRLYNRQR